jgi:hypothetical protein
MNRSAKSQAPSFLPERAISGLRRKFEPEKPGKEILDGENLGELWELVDFWITQIVPGDPRRRLLELARLRHDSRLAGAVLRFL